MVWTSFGCPEHPFRGGFEERLVYRGRALGEALEGLRRGIGVRQGLSVLTGPAGVGKTTLLLTLVADLEAESGSRTVRYFPAPVPALDALVAACRAGTDRSGEFDPLAVGDGLHALSRSWSSADLVVLVDEAQSLSDEALGDLLAMAAPGGCAQGTRAIVLAGEPPLAQRVARQRLVGSASPLVARYALGPLDETEVSALVRHRLKASGCSRDPIFDTGALERIAQLAAGIPGTINSLCRLALFFAAEARETRVAAASVERAAAAILLGQHAADGVRSKGRSAGDGSRAGTLAAVSGSGAEAKGSRARGSVPSSPPPHRGSRSVAALLGLSAALLPGSLLVLPEPPAGLSPARSLASSAGPGAGALAGSGEGDGAAMRPEAAGSAGPPIGTSAEASGKAMAVPPAPGAAEPLGSPTLPVTSIVARNPPDAGSTPATTALTAPAATIGDLSPMEARYPADGAEGGPALVYAAPVATGMGATPPRGSASDSPTGSLEPDDSAATPSEIDRLLERAAAHLKADRLVAPRFDNALAVYRKVLRADPGNPTALAGLTAIKAKLTEYAQAEAAKGDLDSARRQLNKLRALDQGAGPGQP